MLLPSQLQAEHIDSLTASSSSCSGCVDMSICIAWRLLTELSMTVQYNDGSGWGSRTHDV